MSFLGWALSTVIVICLLFAIAYQADLMEERYQARLREWAPNDTGSARVVDYEAWRRSTEIYEYHWSNSPEQEAELRAEGYEYAGETGKYPSRLMRRLIKKGA